MQESYLKTLLVVQTHFMDSVFIHMLIIFIFKVSEERCEHFSDPSNNLRSLQPDGEFSLHLFEIDSCIIHIFIAILISLKPSHVSHSLLSELHVYIIICIFIIEVVLECARDSALAPRQESVLNIQLHVNVLPCIVRKLFMFIIVKTHNLITIKLWFILVVTITRTY